MRLITWNVNGIRSIHGKGFAEWLRNESPDVLCLQEVKASPEQLTAEMVTPPGYTSVWNPAEKKGYSGVAVFTKQKPLAIRLGLGEAAFDSEGRVVEVEFPKFTLVNAYFPNSQRDHARLDFKIAFCKKMFHHLEAVRERGKPALLCGDFNIAHQAIDLKNPKQNENNAGFLPQERQWMDFLLSRGYVDTFRNFHQAGGHYTWWSYRPGVREKNIGWRLDYFVCSDSLRPMLKSARHHTLVPGSDHCPVELQLDVHH